MSVDTILLNKVEHPSKLQRKKLEELRKDRLTKALRENLRKRKDQVRGRKAE
jgi:tRNA A37 threonylcarbamoyladenosine dehydratase